MKTSAKSRSGPRTCQTDRGVRDADLCSRNENYCLSTAEAQKEKKPAHIRTRASGKSLSWNLINGWAARVAVTFAAKAMAELGVLAHSRAAMAARAAAG